MEKTNKIQNYKNIKAKHNDLNNEIATIYIRNYAKKASKLSLPTKLKMNDFRSIISRRMSIPQQQLEVFLQGKLVEKQIGEIQLYNSLIFHLIDTDRVYVPQIVIYLHRIQQNSLTHMFKISSSLRIQEFISMYLRQKYQQIQNYFLVSSGRQLSTHKTFQQQLIESQSEILLIHKIENLKKKKKNITKQENHEINNAKNAGNNCNSINADDKIEDALQFARNPNSNIQIDGKSQDITQKTDLGIKYKLYQWQQGKQTSKNNDYSQNGFETKVQSNTQKKPQQQLLQQDQNTPQQLYQTAKFNSVQQINNSRLRKNHHDFNTFEDSNNKNGKFQIENEYEQVEEIVIQNNNAYSYLQKNKNNKEDELLLGIEKTRRKQNNQYAKSQPRHQVITKYGIAPSKTRAQFKRCFQEKYIENQQLTDIQILSQDSGNDSVEVKEIDQEYTVKQTQMPKSDKQFENKLQVQSYIQSAAKNQKMLATISSRYDEEQMYATDSLGKNSLHNFNIAFQNIQNDKTDFIFNATANQQSPFAREKIDVYKIMKNMPLTNSIELVEPNKSENKSQQQIKLTNQQTQYNDQHQNNSQVNEFPIKFVKNTNKQTQNQIALENMQEQNLMAQKRKNKVDVKNMTQTVSPSFFKPNSNLKDQYDTENYKFSSTNQEAKQKKYSTNFDKIKEQQQLINQCFGSCHPFANQDGNEPLMRKTSSSFTHQVKNKQEIKQKLIADNNFDVRMEQSSSSSKLEIPIVLSSVKVPTVNPTKIQDKEQNKEKQCILNNISNVSSIYHQVTNSQSSTHTYEPKVYNLPSPHPMRDSFTSNIKNSHGVEGTWENGSNRLSIGSIESQTLYMMELPESSGELKPSFHKVREQNVDSNSQSNYDNILGSQANITSGIAKKVVFDKQSNIQQKLNENYSSIMKKKKNNNNTNQNLNEIIEITNNEEQLNFSDMKLSEIVRIKKKQGLIQQFGYQSKESIENLLDSQVKKHNRNNYIQTLGKISQIQQEKEGGKSFNIENQEEQLINQSHSLINSQKQIINQLPIKSPQKQNKIFSSFVNCSKDQHTHQQLKYSEQENLLDIYESQYEKQLNDKLKPYPQKDETGQKNKGKGKSNASMSISFGQLMKGQIVQNVEVNIGDMFVISNPFALYASNSIIFGQNKQSFTYSQGLKDTILSEFNNFQSENINSICKQKQITKHQLNNEQSVQMIGNDTNIEDQNLLLNYL